MNARIIEKMVDCVGCIRHLGFNAAGLEDIESYTGQLSSVERKELYKRLTACGAVQRKDNWLFADLDIEKFRKPVLAAELVGPVTRVPAGVWGKDASGKFRFVPDPNFVLEDDEASDDDGADNDPPGKGELSVDL